jgi:S-DNA-T family DNA segregation ATPase FtsK/SpoIIIE
MVLNEPVIINRKSLSFKQRKDKMSIFDKIFGKSKVDKVDQNPSIELENSTKSINKSIPTDLPSAVRYIVEERGASCIEEKLFINILNDFHILKDIPALKNILRNFQEEGYMSKILQFTNWELESQSLCSQYIKDFGAKEDIVKYIISCIGYGMNKVTEIPQYVECNVVKKDALQTFTDPSTQTISFDSTPELPDAKNNSEASSLQQQFIEPYDPKRDIENYRYPTLDLLKKYVNDGKPNIDMAELTAAKNHIVELLRSYGIEISSIKTIVGPIVTLHEISLAPGILISKVRKIEDDFCLLLGSGARIIAPIPGKGTIGIEVPNVTPSIVSMESIINSKRYQESNMELPCAIGKTITNEVFIFDLIKTPHLLVAGATGQGKSICLNTIITSLIYKKHPAELKIVLIDPKKIEFSLYSPLINHFLAQVPSYNSDIIVSSDLKAIQTLNSLSELMDTRLNLLKEVGTRNVREYNKKFIDRRIPPRNGHGYMPYVVVIFDEYGDLMMTAGKEIESPLLRLSQMAHVVGIHLIIATRRLSSKTLTDNLKANFLTKIAFRVPSMSDSKLILDRSGAQQLIGRGDMLYQNYGGEPVRVQCAYVDTTEVERICNYIKKQDSYNMPFELPDPDAPKYDIVENDVDMQHLDPLFEDAARLVVINQSGSTSLIQRKFAIGYNRAGRLMNQLEKAGVVGAAMGSKPREVLIQDEISLNNLLKSFR